MSRNCLAAVFSVIVALSLVGCATGTKMIRADHDNNARLAALEERAVARWQALIDGRPGDAYDYLTPGYRATRSRDEYSREIFRGPIRWQSVTWTGVECPNEASCQVELFLTYSVRMPGAGDVNSVSDVHERWLFVDDAWYHLPER